MARDSNDRISTEELLHAYRLGYFPMARARDDEDIVWVLPDERGVILLDDACAPKRLQRTIKSEPFEIRINTAFNEVILACAENTPMRDETWINDQIIETYCELHSNGIAHSVECWRENQLVGGLYGVEIGGIFCGESMFSRETDASKVAMVHLIARLKAGGYRLIDAQFVNEHLYQFGLVGIPNEEYQIKLKQASLISTAPVFRSDFQLATVRVLQSITQTS